MYMLLFAASGILSLLLCILDNNIVSAYTLVHGVRGAGRLSLTVIVVCITGCGFRSVHYLES